MAIVKYTKEQERELYDSYKECENQEDRERVIEAFASKHNKLKRSVIAKLSKMDIYVTALKISKVTGNIPETKQQLVDRIEKHLGIQGLDGLDKAPKLTLLKLLGER